jgi:hypothetical protein
MYLGGGSAAAWDQSEKNFKKNLKLKKVCLKKSPVSEIINRG